MAGRHVAALLLLRRDVRECRRGPALRRDTEPLVSGRPEAALQVERRRPPVERAGRWRAQEVQVQPREPAAGARVLPPREPPERVRPLRVRRGHHAVHPGEEPQVRSDLGGLDRDEEDGSVRDHAAEHDGGPGPGREGLLREADRGVVQDVQEVRSRVRHGLLQRAAEDPVSGKEHARREECLPRPEAPLPAEFADFQHTLVRMEVCGRGREFFRGNEGDGCET